MRRLRDFLQHHPNVIAYVLVVAVGTFGFVRLQSQADTIQRQNARIEDANVVIRQQADALKMEVRRRDYQRCIDGNAARAVIVRAIKTQAEVLIASAGEEGREVTEQDRRAIELYRARTAQSLAPLGPKPCAKP